ncbi:Protein HOTHEAD [Capsicum annuum]|uniref:Protein HOTHEAD n=1 Tax=Capsicum annuum TaxID=4072 RepID=A0A1U8F3J5_CAPAN|nr:protein HOTHEAD [Capsicum annuum]KAF3643752.1 Protein HOTHEAD [Capsicum annuum]PHT78365.1 Protein HOTHEAD [Capsicum annuum]
MLSSSWNLSIFSSLFGILILCIPCFSEKAPYYTFARDATSAPEVVFFDYIVIGGGTSGCALAATLSQASNVLLLERGGLPYGNPNITNINGFTRNLADTSPSSPSQLFISTDGVFNHRARVLGGGSAINAGFFSRASNEYVKRMGWNPEVVNDSYEWVEEKVAFRPQINQWQSAVRNGLLEVGVRPYNGFTYEHLDGTKVGGSIFDQQGHRHTAADLLEYADPIKISVYLYATVEQIVFRTRGGKKPRAYGVRFQDSEGNSHLAFLNRGSKNEVLLSAGALGSPQMLMLSGIGPIRQLNAHEINVLVDQPMVGMGMSDNPMNAVFVPSPNPVEVSLIQVVGITGFKSYIEAASGPLELDWMRRMAHDFTRVANQTMDSFKIPSVITIPGINPHLLHSPMQAGLILEKVAGPYSTGFLELASKDPNENPVVTFNYFKDARDLQRCVHGMRTVAEVIDSTSFSNFRYPLTTSQALMNTMLTFPLNLRPKHLTASVSFEQFCIDTVMTIWHYHGGCQVGKVVDGDYKVFGVDGLRVIDGSTFIESPGTNPQATVMMLGRYMGQKILGDRLAGRRN